MGGRSSPADDIPGEKTQTHSVDKSYLLEMMPPAFDKKLPNLKGFLQAFVRSGRSQAGSGTALAAISCVVGTCIASLGVVTLASSTRFGIGFLARSHPVGFALCLLCILLGSALIFLPMWNLEKRRRELAKLEEQKVYREALRIAEAMLVAKKLHKQVPTAVAELLELSAGYWQRIQDELHGPYWARALPQHWAELRERLLTASDAAIQEMLVLLNPNFQADAKLGFGDVVEDILEVFSINLPMKHDGRIPTGFIQAREIAEKLKLAAGEVERATREIANDPTMMSEFRSGEALDLALGDLRTIRHAEDELRENAHV